ncbi:glycerophosphodiester phosphodiesterase family protein [Galactobacter sp.]|uniref:glycerophosphodiester phosphodiesterase n=1 Tax=Galactobacter sp. TaxID=2676125 RepID=UPI0025C1F453|nr:glycerophosphodiester phosphodiesterase family protein [Galactobacter sp.]
MISAGLALASCGSVSADEGQATPSTPAAATPGQGTLIIAHRGGSEEGAEGSVDALAEAARDGFPAEFDLRALADGEWAVAHDAEVERILESGEGPVSELTSEQWLKSCIRQEGDAQDSEGCESSRV